MWTTPLAYARLWNGRLWKPRQHSLPLHVTLRVTLAWGVPNRIIHYGNYTLLTHREPLHEIYMSVNICLYVCTYVRMYLGTYVCIYKSLFKCVPAIGQQYNRGQLFAIIIQVINMRLWNSNQLIDLLFVCNYSKRLSYSYTFTLNAFDNGKY